MKKMYKILLSTVLLFTAISASYAAPVMPQISSGGNEYWYQIVFQRYDASLVLQDNGDDVILTAQTISTADATKQLWKVEESNGNYIISSKGGRKLYWDGTSRFKAGTTGTEMKLIATTNTTYPDSYELQRNGGTQGLNPYGGSTAGNQIGETTMADGGNCVRFVPQGLAPYITLSSGATEYWYNIEFTNNRNVWLKDTGEDSILKVERLVIGSNDFFWKIEAGATFGQYVITSKNGRKLYWDGTAGRYKSATSGTAVAVEFITAGSHLWRIRRPGSGTNMNGSSGAAVENEVNEYNDHGGNLRFVKTPFKVSDDTNTYWYRVSDSRATTYYWYNGTYSSNPNSLMVSQLASLPKNSYHSYFKFVKNSTGNGYLIYSAAQPTTAFARKNGYLQAEGTTGEPMFISSTPNTSLYNSKYIIQRESNQKQYNSFTGEGFKVWEYDDLGDAGNQWKFEEITLSDATIKTNYTDLRTAARKLYNYSAAGTYFGKFPAADRATFLAVIAAEEAKNADNLSSSQHIEGYNALFNAIATYKSKVITDVATITSMAASPKWFYISSNATNAGYAMAKVMTSNGVDSLAKSFKFETKANTDAQYWRFEAVTGGVRIINKAASGYEFGDPTSVAAGSGTTYIPAIYTNDGFSITLAKSGNSPLHAQQSGSVIVKWPASDGGASLWVLQAKDENLTNGTAVVPVVSTLANPVYYYIFSAADGRANRAGTPDATTPYDFRQYALISPAADGFLKWGVPAGDNALWAIVDVSGTKKLYNKGTGKYMTGSHSQNSSGEALTYTPFTSPNDLQYEIKSGTNSFVIPYNLNTANRNSTLGAFSQTAWYFVAPTYTGTGDITTASNWSTAAVPAQEVAVVINGDATVNANTSYNSITINAGKSLTVAAGKQLTVSGTTTNNGSIVLQSDGTNGTATVTGNVGGTATVHQAIDKYRSWYMSLPVNNVSGNTGVGSYSTFAESTDTWSVGSALSGVSAGTGVAINPTDNSVTSLSFTGTLNNGDVNLPGLSSGNKRWHYVGNPYPSYLAWSGLTKTNLEETVWFRTEQNNAYTYATWNGSVGTNGADNTIAPLQGFWVRVDAGQTGTLGFTNNMRSHDSSGNKLLRAPQASEMSLLRLTVSNGSLSDEAVVYFKEGNLNGKDRFDAAKIMNGNNVPEIYTLLNGEATVINAMESVPYGVELPLGFNTKVAGNFTISASEFSHFAADDRVLLLDKSNNSLTDLSLGAYSFESGATTTNDRFAIKLVPGSATGIDKTTDGAYIFANNNRQLVVSLAGANEGASIRIYTVAGQQIAAQALTTRVTTLRAPLNNGAYVVEIINGGKQSVQRVIVK